jgi:DNA-directed RNA polymerase specialized sigma24 family protein
MNHKQEVKRKRILVQANTDYRKNLNSYAFFRLKNRAISEDLVQDTFKKTWLYLVRGGQG